MLLTRPPLRLISFCRSFIPLISVRLACVRHAASVRPEPGSNSLKNCIFTLSCRNHFLKCFLALYFFKTLKRLAFVKFWLSQNYCFLYFLCWVFLLSKNLQGSFYLSRRCLIFKVQFCAFQAFSVWPLSLALVYNNKRQDKCQQLFSIFLHLFENCTACIENGVFNQ